MAGQGKEQRQVYANRRRINGRRGKDLQRLRSELTERSFAHMYETGGMRRTHLRKRNNILKRLLLHAVGFNLALLVREHYGIGKPRTLQGVSEAILLLQIVMAASETYDQISRRKRPSQSTPSGFLSLFPSTSGD